MLITVTPRDCFDVPAGRYRATCVDAHELYKETPQGPERYLRLVWELAESPDRDVRYLVGKNYPPHLTNRSVLRKDLRTWLGHDVDPGEFNTDTLVGKEATVTVVQIFNENHAQPYCWVSKVDPPFKDPEDGEEILVE